jgi:flagellar L-ring protein precursor FlgH
MKYISLFLLIMICAHSQMGRTISLFTDKRSLDIGQAITVDVMEFSEASSVGKTETKRDDKNKLEGKVGTGLLDFIPSFGAEGGNSFTYKGEGKTSKKGSLKTKITVQIVGKTVSEDLIIEGSRVIEINGEKELFVLSGNVRPQDVSSTNTVFSYQIYNSKIVFKGKGDIADSQSKGIVSRFLGWIF